MGVQDDWLGEQGPDETQRALQGLLAGAGDSVKLELFRDFYIENITNVIKKFPIQTQKEILVILTHTFMCDWSDNDAER